MSSFNFTRTACALLVVSGTAFAQIANQDQTIFAPAPIQDDFFGFSIDIDGDRMVVGSPVIDTITADTGSAWVYERNAAGDWVLIQELSFSMPDLNDYYGWDVTVSGDRIAVGSILDDDTGPGPDGSGAVFIWEETAPGVWTETDKLFSSTPVNQGQFGYSVDLQGDRLVVGSRGDDQFRGAAFVFEYDPIGMSWTETKKLTATDAAVNDRFGEAVSLDAGRIVVGADADTHSGQATAGSAYVFEFVPALSDWRLAEKLTAPTPNTNDAFGVDVAISGDYAYIGAPAEDQAAPALGNSGGVFVYKRLGVQNWSYLTTIVSSNPETSGQFGASIDVDGDTLIVGANGGDDGDPLIFTGAAYLIDREPGDTFTERMIFRGTDVAVDALDDFFASAVSISGENFAADYGSAVDPISMQTNVGAVYTFTDGTLFHGAPTISVASGGEQQFLIRGGAALANQVFIILGSGAGTSPGTLDSASGVTIPLNFDQYLLTLINGAGAGLIGPWFAFLDGDGAGNSKFGIPAGTNPTLAGTVLHHAAITVDIFGTGILSTATNPVKVTLVP